MNILALHEDSNANITFLANTEIVFSVAEERFTRKKHQGGFPRESLAYLFKKYDLAPNDIDVIVCGNRYHPLPRLLGPYFPSHEHAFLGWGQKVSLYYQHALSKSLLLRSAVEKLNHCLLTHKFKRSIFLVDHHTAHAYATYLTSGFSEALIISADNYGDGVAAAVFTGKEGTCTMLYSSSALHSPGQFYGELAQILGFHPLMAGKMTGLSAYGDPGRAYPLVKELFGLTPDKKDFVLPSLFFKSPNRGIFQKLRAYKKEDVAAAAQRRFEEVIVSYAREALRTTGLRKIALAGGIFGNVCLNKKIAELEEVDEIFIHPGMSDQGISLGAGLAYLAQEKAIQPFRIENVYWGPQYNGDQIKQTLTQQNVAFLYDPHIEQTVADLLARGKVVARFNGRTEYGPRALGNRSILYRTTDGTVNDWLNRKLRRSAFMPFAPVTLEEEAQRCYNHIPKIAYTAKFMTIACECTEWMKSVSPGVVHIDSTARPQILSQTDNPSYYAILKEYHRLTGIPSLINTSFNMHHEPIVNTPAEALEAFLQAGIDYLAIGNYLVEKQ